MISEITNQVDAVAAALAWERTPLGTVLIDADGKVCNANHAAAEYLGMRATELAGIGEAEFVLRSEALDHRRMELAQAGLRSIHFIRRPANASSAIPRLARIAEELREPLASIYGFTELLIYQSYDDETRRELTMTILGEIEIMMDLINRQLDLTHE
jgi:signal transduction histidine kinase